MRLSQPTLRIGPSEPAPVVQPPPRRKRRWWLAVLPLLLLACAAAAWLAWAPPKAVEAQGRLMVRRFEATPRGQGRVLWRAGPAGTLVKSGERVLEVERIGPEVPVPEVVPVAEAPAQELLLARVATAKAEALDALVRERISSEALQRAEDLFARGGAILPEVERAREEQAQARAALQAARARMREAELYAAPRPPPPPPAAPPAEREVFYAPFDAKVMAAPVAEGEVTAPNEPALVLVEQRPEEVEAMVRADRVGLLRPGGPAEVELVGERGSARHLGLITAIGGPSQEPRPASNRRGEVPPVPVRVRLASPLASDDGAVAGRPCNLRMQVGRR